ncbi:MAG TPA: hypothetical protein VLE95_08965 [Chlamydiales bacterium]|nr:hypothetical protein [Chlamydiales bacterium]
MRKQYVILNEDYPAFDSKEYLELEVYYPAGTKAELLDVCHMSAPPHGIEFGELVFMDQRAKEQGRYLVLIEKTIISIPAMFVDFIRDETNSSDQSGLSAKEILEKLDKENCDAQEIIISTTRK